jgi:hypothetical protein
MAEIDGLLSDVFGRVAQPGDPSGVVESIRSRVAGGDTGTPADGAIFGRDGWSWLPWLGTGVVVAVVGAVVGASGVIAPLGPGAFGAGASSGQPGVGGAVAFGLPHTTAGLDCPGGRPVAALYAGDRVLAVARSDDSAYLGVRNPADLSGTVWVPVADIVVDPGQAPVDELEVDGCPTTLIEVIEPEPEPEPSPEPRPDEKPKPGPKPGPVTPPAPEPDKTAPKLGTPSGAQNIACGQGYPKPETTTISISATDDKAVTGVSISWSGADSGSGSMTKSGSNWSFTYNPPNTTFGNVTFTLVARDGAGNQSGAKSFVVNVDCLI